MPAKPIYTDANEIQVQTQVLKKKRGTVPELTLKDGTSVTLDIADASKFGKYTSADLKNEQNCVEQRHKKYVAAERLKAILEKRKAESK
jgi:hypothetical protein